MSSKSDCSSMGNESSVAWSRTYNEIKNKHDLAFKIIQDAIFLEEQEKSHEAVQKYNEGVELINEILNILVECPDNPDDTWKKASEMIAKIKRARTEVLIRVNCIESSPGFATPNDEPPSYEEATSSECSSYSSGSRYRNFSSTLKELLVDPKNELQRVDNVRLYFISPSGEVLSTREPQVLKVALIEDTDAFKAILQIGDYIYPLITGVCLYYRTDYGAFILPDVYSSELGSSIGIILPPDVSVDVLDLLDNILYQIVSEKTDQEICEEKSRIEELEDSGTRISNSIINGAIYISQGLVLGAQKAEDLLNRGTPVLISKVSRCATPKEIPPSVSTGVKIAECATNSAVRVTDFLVDKIGAGAVKLGHFLAPHVEKQGTKLLVRSFNMPQARASEKMKNFLTIAGGAAEGFSTVCRGLETSGGILRKSLKENTVKIVAHKYGPSAAETTEDSLNTVGNVYATIQNARFVRPTRLAKKAVGRGIQHFSPTSNGNRLVMERLAEPSHNTPKLDKPSTSENHHDISKENNEKPPKD